ncbi:3',5'-cyclic AMP phosphodiesterase CpdA [Nocardia transvalensis]|uniref:3',5'-cyclic AMP phosphodiesterase CpdA n=1 Tax=Nocardia transvalensis TaxID=37333 RepID=A0A7W9UHE3_9NOCA|nr:metallophosphoesterase [Nocardia transvalensis]MBB5913037.1 3',5'-cyclic AMP phosphodiesterase CpdA [Nocardia transvalensis]
MIVLAQLSDTHFDLRARNTARTERVMAYLAGLPRRPDAILVTGDITDSGKAEEYEQAHAVLRADVPVAVLPGNHDDRANLREALLDQPASQQPINQTLRLDGLTVALLDSTVPGEGGGELSGDTYDWLLDLLAETPADTTVLVALHHPPVPMHSTVVDPIRLANPQRLERIVAADERVVGVITGHMHSMGTTLFGGRQLVVAPSVASQIGGEWEVGAPGEVPIDYAPDPSLVLHAIDGRRMTSIVRAVPMGGRIAVQPD